VPSRRSPQPDGPAGSSDAAVLAQAALVLGTGAASYLLATLWALTRLPQGRLTPLT
jgi:hypothetical protein